MSSVAAHRYDSSNTFIHQASGQDNTTYKEFQRVGINPKFMTGRWGAHPLIGEVRGPRTSRGGGGPTYFSGRLRAHVLLGEVGGPHTSRGGRGPHTSQRGTGPTYFSGR